jgi:hypothetical protein
VEQFSSSVFFFLLLLLLLLWERGNKKLGFIGQSYGIHCELREEGMKDKRSEQNEERKQAHLHHPHPLSCQIFFLKCKYIYRNVSLRGEEHLLYNERDRWKKKL